MSLTKKCWFRVINESFLCTFDVRFIPFQDVLKNHPTIHNGSQHNGWNTMDLFTRVKEVEGGGSGRIQEDGWSKKERKKEWMGVPDLAARNFLIANIIREE